MNNLSRTLFPTLACSVALACSAPSGGILPTPDAGIGQVEFALETSVDGVTYALRNATFAITGEQEVQLQSQDEAGAVVLQHALPAGDYSVELQPGWQLLDTSAPDPLPLLAVLQSENPVPFSVQSGEVTAVQYAFSVLAEPPSGTGTGSVEVGIDVTRGQSRALIFSEFMSNPAALADSAGEWFELSNVGSEAFQLQGCVLARDTSQFTINTPLSVAPGEAVSFANSDAPGFVPHQVYTGLTLPNAAVFVLQLTCAGELMDSITVDPATWPAGNGVAASLSASVTNAEANDDVTRWCAASDSYSADKGSPGLPNPTCP